MKTLLVGNGFNVQFGGMAYTSNFIMKRIKFKSKLGEYQALFGDILTDIQISDVFNNFIGTANDIRTNLYDNYAVDEDEIDALLDFKSRYNFEIIEPHDIMLEDWFFILHLYLNKNSDIEDKQSIKQGFEHLILDGIFNDGKTQELYMKMPKTVKKWVAQYDHVFTLNYDNNLEQLTDKPIYHLHGDFSVLSNSENPETVEGWLRTQNNQTVVIQGLEHCFCNALLDFSGKLKYHTAQNSHNAIEASKAFSYQYTSDSDWRKKLEDMKETHPHIYEQIITKLEHPHLKMGTEYHFSTFENIEGELYILGMSPNNDDHIFDRITQNKKITKVIFYYYSDAERQYVERTYDSNFFTCAEVQKLWKDLGCMAKVYNCNHRIPNDIDKFIDEFNALSGDTVTKEEILDGISHIPQFEAIRLGKLARLDIQSRNPLRQNTDENEFKKQLASLSRIALREGILPSVLQMLSVVYYNQIEQALS